MKTLIDATIQLFREHLTISPLGWTDCGASATAKFQR